MFQLEDVSLFYPAKAGPPIKALNQINLSIEPGDRLIIIGPSGCGKTSLLLLLAGLVKPSCGRVLYGTAPLEGPKNEISLILQSFGLFPWKTVWENACLGLILKKASLSESKARVAHLLEMLGILDQADKYPGQLSGGQQQRVAIARALATGPEHLLMDEPFSALDALTREQMQSLLFNLWRKLNFTMILVTHSIEEAVFLGNKIVVLSPSPGRLVHILYDDGNYLGRDSPQFYRQCSLIRTLLEDPWNVL